MKSLPTTGGETEIHLSDARVAQSVQQVLLVERYGRAPETARLQWVQWYEGVAKTLGNRQARLSAWVTVPGLRAEIFTDRVYYNGGNLARVVALDPAGFAARVSRLDGGRVVSKERDSLTANIAAWLARRQPGGFSGGVSTVYHVFDPSGKRIEKHEVEEIVRPDSEVTAEVKTKLLLLAEYWETPDEQLPQCDEADTWTSALGSYRNCVSHCPARVMSVEVAAGLPENCRCYQRKQWLRENLLKARQAQALLAG